MSYQWLRKKVKELCESVERHPVVVGELENVDGPINLNPALATPIAWGGWQSQNNSRVAVSGSEAEIVVDACAVQVSASVTFFNDTAAATGNAQRAHPELWLLRNGVRVALAQTYIRDVNGHDSDTATISWWDLNPVAGTTYSLEVQQDSIDNPATGQAAGTLEVFRDPEIASYLQVAAFQLT